MKGKGRLRVPLLTKGNLQRMVAIIFLLVLLHYSLSYSALFQRERAPSSNVISFEPKGPLASSSSSPSIQSSSLLRKESFGYDLLTEVEEPPKPHAPFGKVTKDIGNLQEEKRLTVEDEQIEEGLFN